MRYEITKSFRFEAAHSLPHLPPDHQCHRLHGHSYEIIVGVSGPLRNEWVIDYADITRAVVPTIALLDHRNLDGILPMPTTAENLAMWIWHSIERELLALRTLSLLQSESATLSRIEVRETPTSNVILTRG